MLEKYPLAHYLTDLSWPVCRRYSVLKSGMAAKIRNVKDVPK